MSLPYPCTTLPCAEPAPCPCRAVPRRALSCPMLSCSALPGPALARHFHSVFALLPCPPHCSAPWPVLHPVVPLRHVIRPALPLPCPPPYPVLSFTLRCRSSRHSNRFAFANPLSPARPVSRSTQPLLCIHLDCLRFVPPCTQLCLCAVIILTPDLCPAPVCVVLPARSPYSAIYSLLLSLPPLSACHALAPVWPSTMTCPWALFVMFFIPSDLSYLLPSALPVATF